MDPNFEITIADKKYQLRFDVNSNDTKKGVKLQFIIGEDIQDPKDKQALENHISILLQKKFGAAGIAISHDDRTPYKNVIGFLVPLNSIAILLIKVLKG